MFCHLDGTMAFKLPFALGILGKQTEWSDSELQSRPAHEEGDTFNVDLPLVQGKMD